MRYFLVRPMIPFLCVRMVIDMTENLWYSRVKNTDSGHFGQCSASLFFGDIVVAFVSLPTLINQRVGGILLLRYCMQFENPFFISSKSTLFRSFKDASHCLSRDLRTKAVKYSVNLLSNHFCRTIPFLFADTLKGIFRHCSFPFGDGTPPGTAKNQKGLFVFSTTGRVSMLAQQGESIHPSLPPPIPSRRPLLSGDCTGQVYTIKHTPAPLRVGH